MSEKKPLILDQLRPDQVPSAFKAQTYFDFDAHPFAHRQLFDRTRHVVHAIASIADYAARWLKQTIDERLSRTHGSAQTYRDSVPSGIAHGQFDVILEPGSVFQPAVVVGHPHTRNRIYLAQNARLIGATLWPADGEIFIGPGTVVEPGAGIKGPAIIGAENELRQGAYLRGSIIIGDHGVFRGELKNTVLMDRANFPHPSYVGDSLCGYQSHFGNQAGTANLGLFYPFGDKGNVRVEVDGLLYDLGRPKIGIILGDFSQVGCSTVTAPGTFLGPYNIVYPLTALPKGVQPAQVIIKYKPHLELAAFHRTSKAAQS